MATSGYFFMATDNCVQRLEVAFGDDPSVAVQPRLQKHRRYIEVLRRLSWSEHQIVSHLAFLHPWCAQRALVAQPREVAHRCRSAPVQS